MGLSACPGALSPPRQPLVTHSATQDSYPCKKRSKPFPSTLKSLLSNEDSGGQSGPSTGWQESDWPPPPAQAQSLSEIQW